MPIDEMDVGVFSALFRLLGRLFIEVFFEILIKGLGYLICKPFKKVGLDSLITTVVGLLAWVLIIVVVVITSEWISKNLAIDSCLDNGGRYDYEANVCEYE